MNDRSKLITEHRNERSMHLDRMSIVEAFDLISGEDAAIAVQSAYLLSLAPSEWQEALRSLAATRARETDRKGWETRLEVVSIAEALR